MNDEERMAVVAAGRADYECSACDWLGDEPNVTLVEIGPGRYRPTDYRCPHCGACSIRDYESALYQAGYR